MDTILLLERGSGLPLLAEIHNSVYGYNVRWCHSLYSIRVSYVLR